MRKIKTQEKNIYLTSSKFLYLTDRYEHIVDYLKKLFPNDVIIPARELYPTPDSFFEKWPIICQTLDILIIADYNGYLGKASIDEINDAIENGVEILYLTNSMDLIKYSRTKITIVDETNWRFYAQIKVLKGAI